MVLSPALPVAVIEVLQQTKTIAVVGLSLKPERPSHYVSVYLQHVGYRILPVNELTEPGLKNVLGHPCVASLQDLTEAVDLVLCFRRSEQIPAIAAAAIAIHAKALWMQQGIENADAAATLTAAGLRVVQDRCMMVDHRVWTAR